MVVNMDGNSGGYQASVAGVIEDIIYQNEDSGYAVCELEDESGDLIVIEGTIPFIAAGDRITAYGAWVNHPKYGRQLKTEYYEKKLPTEVDDILKYLSSGAVKGIGPKTAIKIVDKYGADSLDIIENHPDWLTEISGITPKKAAAISEHYREISGARSVMMFCRNFFSPATSMKIYKKWGGSAVERIREDPFLLCGEFDGISFRRADQMAQFVGISADDPKRVYCGVKSALSSIVATNGHTCAERSRLAEVSAELVGLDTVVTDTAISELIARGELIATSVGDKKVIYLPKYFLAENYSAKRLLEIDRLCPGLGITDAYSLLAKAEGEFGLEFAENQREAIISAFDCGVMILTGGPGTGKTTIIRALLSIFDSIGLDCALAAPTGRAAKRMSEATSVEAKTVHRMLEMDKAGEDSAHFMRNEDCKLDEDVFIIDEASMIDVLLLEAFLRAVKNGSKVILIGDSDQLPSVGAGYVLSDLISSECFKTIRLREIFRQARGSLIVTNAHRINNGELPDIHDKKNDFFFMPRESDEEIAATVAQLCAVRLPRSYGDGIRDKIQVISPSRKGIAGTNALNIRLQALLNPDANGKKSRQRGDVIFREGDRVMQVKNDYSLEWEKDGKTGVGVFNGDIGVIVDIDTQAETVTVSFEERLVEYGFGSLDELEPAYAITVHKSQGCEYPVVIIPIYNCAPMLLTRNLLYTAVTRASRMVILVGSSEIMSRMISNNTHIERLTGLRELLLKKR